jgi:hypothetical protein
MAGRTSRDYDRYEAEFVTSSLTMRAFARSKGLPAASISRMAHKPDANGLTWYDKQQAYKLRTTEKAYEILADRDAIQLSARMDQMLRIGDGMLDLIEKQMPVWEAQIEAGKAPFGPKEVTAVMDQVRALIGQPGKAQKEDRGKFGFLGIVGSDGRLDLGLAAELERGIRPLLVDNGAEERTPEPVAASAGTD